MNIYYIIGFIIAAIVIGVIVYYFYTKGIPKEGCGCGVLTKKEGMTIPMCPCTLYATSPSQMNAMKEISKNHKKYHGCDCEIIPKYDTNKKPSYNLNESFHGPFYVKGCPRTNINNRKEYDRIIKTCNQLKKEGKKIPCWCDVNYTGTK
jgi:hypothetical protein